MSPQPPPDAYLQLAQALSILKLEKQQEELFKATPVSNLDSSGFLDVVVNLANADLAGGGLQVPIAGFEATYLRRPSTPGGLLQVAIGGMSKPFAPGDKFVGSFPNGLLLKLAPGSVAAGTAVLRVAQQPQIHFFEFQGDDVNVTPVALLGTLVDGAVTFVVEAEDTDPSGASPAGSFSCSGWKKLLLLIDTTSNAGTATTFTLVPWYQPPASTTWFEQGTQAVDVPDTYSSGGQFRIVEWNITGAQGKMYFSIRNLLAAARTGLQFCVLGVG